MEMYSIYDRKLRQYGGIMLSRNDEVMSREIRAGVRPDSMPGQYPDDFELHKVGSFDEDSGEIVQIGRPILVYVLSDILKNGEVKHAAT